MAGAWARSDLCARIQHNLGSWAVAGRGEGQWIPWAEQLVFESCCLQIRKAVKVIRNMLEAPWELCSIPFQTLPKDYEPSNSGFLFNSPGTGTCVQRAGLRTFPFRSQTAHTRGGGLLRVAEPVSRVRYEEGTKEEPQKGQKSGNAQNCVRRVLELSNQITGEKFIQTSSHIPAKSFCGRSNPGVLGQGVRTGQDLGLRAAAGCGSPHCSFALLLVPQG